MTKRFTVLMVDDDEDDWVLVRQAFAESEFTCDFEVDLEHLRDGMELLEYLDRRSRKALTPDLILLDLNMPRMDGREALKRVKSHSVYLDIPVVVLTTSRDPADVMKCYECGGNMFYQKPHTFEGLKQIIETVSNHWFCTTHARLRVMNS